MKKFISLVLAVMLVGGLLAACGNKTTKQSEVSTQPTAAPTAAPTAKPVDPVEISWLVFETPGLTTSMYQSIIDKFEQANPNIKIKKELYPDSDRDAFNKTLLATKRLPDVMLEGVAGLTTANALLELTPDDYSFMEDSAISKFNGKVFYLPLTKQIKLNMFYNKKIFADNGLTVPTTWDEFLAICKKLKAKGISPLITGGSATPWVTGGLLIGPMLSSTLQEYNPNYDSDLLKGNMKWTDPVIKNEITLWQDLVKAGYFHPGSTSFTYPQHVEEFFKGNAAMIANGGWMAAQSDTTKKDFEVGWFPLPYNNDKVKYYQVGYGGQLAISAATKHPEEAKKFVKFLLTNKDAYVAYLKADGANSTTKEPVTYEMGPTQQEMSKGLEGLTPMLGVDGYSGDLQFPTGFYGFYSKSLQSIFAGADVSTELDKWEKEFRDELKAEAK